MPISDFLNDNEFSGLLKNSITYPKFTEENPDIVVPRNGSNPSLVGIAFELLLHYELLRYHINTKPIVGLYFSNLMLGQKRPNLNNKVIYKNRGYKNPKEIKVIRYILPSALGAIKISQIVGLEDKNKFSNFYKYAERELMKYDNSLFRNDGNVCMPDEIFILALKLSKLENYYRSNVFPGDFDYVSDSDLNDLKALIKCFDSSKLNSERYCLCSPYFSYKGKHVHGFDMDCVLDNTIIDIKTTTKHSLTKYYVNQLVIYYLLSRVFGIEGYPVKNRIEKVAIYFARYDSLWISDIRDILGSKNEIRLKKWIKERSNQ